MTLSSLTLWFRYFILSLSLLQWSSLTSPLQWSQPCPPRPDLTPHPTIRPHPSMTDMLLLLTQSTQVSKRKETWYILHSVIILFHFDLFQSTVDRIMVFPFVCCKIPHIFIILLYCSQHYATSDKCGPLYYSALYVYFKIQIRCFVLYSIILK